MAKDLKAFLQDNKRKKKNIFYAVSKDFVDENGKPIKWELKHIKARVADEIRSEAMSEDGENFDFNLYAARVMAESVVYPDLRDIELQDSYGVNTPEDLLYEMVDNPGELSALQAKVFEMAGLAETAEEKVEQAKNS